MGVDEFRNAVRGMSPQRNKLSDIAKCWPLDDNKCPRYDSDEMKKALKLLITDPDQRKTFQDRINWLEGNIWERRDFQKPLFELGLLTPIQTMGYNSLVGMC